MDLKYFLSMKDRCYVDKLDIAMVEGAITTERDLREIKKVRAIADILSHALQKPVVARNNYHYWAL